MSPYSRFNLVSNTISASVIVAGLAIFGPPGFSALKSVAATPTAEALTLGAAVTVLVVFWLALTQAIFPILFRLTSVRRIVLGKYYVEGTWLQAERADGEQRMAVIDIQPDGAEFIFSGYALNERFEVESNALIEFSEFNWPFMSYKFRNSLSDGSDGQREGVGEIHFEMNRDAAERYNGFRQHIRSSERVKIEGAKLTANREVKKLRSLAGRRQIFSKYWALFFDGSVIVTRTSSIPKQSERRIVEPQPSIAASADDEVGKIVPRRRATDWAGAERDAAAKSEVDAEIDAEIEKVIAKDDAPKVVSASAGK